MASGIESHSLQPKLESLNQRLVQTKLGCQRNVMSFHSDDTQEFFHQIFAASNNSIAYWCTPVLIILLWFSVSWRSRYPWNSPDELELHDLLSWPYTKREWFMCFIHGLYVTYLRSLAIVGYLTTGRICVQENGESERVYVIRNALRCWSVKWVYFRQSALPLQNRNPYTPKIKVCLAKKTLLTRGSYWKSPGSHTFHTPICSS